MSRKRGGSPGRFATRTIDPMDIEAFREFLKRGGRSRNATDRAIEYVRQFEGYLVDHGRDLDEADPADLESFAAEIEAEPGTSAKLHLWGVRYYYEFIDDPIMVHVAAVMRRDRVEETPFKLRQFRGVDLSYTDRLAADGIRTADDLLAAAATQAGRVALNERTNVPPAAIEELVQLSDLARIDGIKAIRARLYLDAGVRSVADLAGWDPVELVAVLKQHVADTGFAGIAPQPGEARHAVATAQRLNPLIEW